MGHTIRMFDLAAPKLVSSVTHDIRVMFGSVAFKSVIHDIVGLVGMWDRCMYVNGGSKRSIPLP
jgi:hypothetical protein